MTSGKRADPAERGVIEGFYGRPFTHAQRCDLLQFIGAHGYNCYVYAPKNDPLHRERWRESYPAEELGRFRELGAVAARSGVRFMYALAPGLSYDATDPRDFVQLDAKLRDVIRAGARGIALLFDDLTADSTVLDPGVQADLVARVADLVASIDPGLAFWFIGNFYCGAVAELRSSTGFWSTLYGRSAEDYFAAYQARVPATVPIMWTGPAVFSGTLTERDALDFRDLARRPIVLWDNFPVNDTLPGHLFLGPYVGREPGAVRALHGVVLNLMSQAAANRIPLATAADFFADGAGYDPDASLARAVASVAPGREAALHLATFVEHHRGHPVLAADATASALDARVRAAFATAAPDAQALESLCGYLSTLVANEDRLERALAGHELLADIAPWSRQLTRLAQAALLGVEALQGRARREAYESALQRARGHDEVVAATPLPPALLPFVAGQGVAVDRFAELFAALESRLGVA